MGRRKAFDRDDAVITVMNEIWEHGYDACSTKALAEKLGITRSSFYNAFGTREELFLEALEAYNGPTPDRGWFPIDEGGPVLKVVSEHLQDICKARTRAGRGCMVICSVTELVGKKDQVGSAVADLFSTNIEYLESVLSIAVERGELEKCNLRVKALALQSVLVGLNVMSKVIRDEDELWAATKHSLKALDLYAE